MDPKEELSSRRQRSMIGEDPRMVRKLFVMARERAPNIIFMDEINSIGSSRREQEQW